MRSTSRRLAPPRWRRAAARRTAWLVAALLIVPLPAFSWQGRRISIYFPGTMVSLQVLDRNGHEYADLAQVLGALGPLRVKRDGRSWTASLGKREAEFEEGKTRSRVAGTSLELAHPLLVEEGRGLVPVSSLPRVLGRLLDTRVDVHESARRIFVGSAATRFTAQVVREEAPALVLTFTSAVSPAISTERNSLRMVFQRDAVVSGTPIFRFEGGPVASATFHESDGQAEIILQGEAPLLAAAREDGRKLVITAAPAAPQPASTLPPAPAIPSEGGADASLPLAPSDASTAPQGLPGLPPPVPRQRCLVVLDASHGGSERGAALSDEVAEKDVTLALARRLRSELQNRGVATVMVRENDSDIAMDARAVLSNTSQATIFITLHAAVLGRGVRIYTSLLAPARPDTSSFLPWETAQAGHVEASRVLSGAVAAEMARRRIAAVALAAPIRPLNNVTAAAIAVEVMPPTAEVRSINFPNYQQQVAAAVAAAVAQVRGQLESAP